MIKLVMLFKRPANSGSFDIRFLRNLDLLKKMPGVVRIEAGSVIGGPAGDSPYYRQLELVFEDYPALDAALTSPEGVAAGKDLMDFASRTVELFFVETMEALEQVPLTPAHLQAFLDEEDIAAEIIYPDVPTPTVPAAAAALGVDPNQIVKSVLFLVDGKPFLVYGCGTRRVDRQKIAQRLNISPNKVKLANADQVLNITGYQVGTVPPIGLKTPMPVFMDPAILEQTVIYAGGGGVNALLRLESHDLKTLSRAEVVPVLEDDDGPTQP